MKLSKNSGSKKREKSLEISRFLAVWLAKRLFPSSGSKLTCHHVFTGQFRCRICVSQFRCNMKVHFSLGDDERTLICRGAIL